MAWKSNEIKRTIGLEINHIGNFLDDDQKSHFQEGNTWLQLQRYVIVLLRNPHLIQPK